MDIVLDCQIYRRFGVEVELNTLDGIVKKLDEDKKEIPLGAEMIAHIIRTTLNRRVEIHGWHPTHNNDEWIVKPDSSCGIEVCTPILKGWTGLRSLLQVIQAFSRSEVKADRRCSMHVHVNIADLKLEQLASVLAYYIKCEHVLFDSLPLCRKNNRYCQFVGMSDLFSHETPMDPEEIISRVSQVKYYSVNAYHFLKGGGYTWRNHRKQTLEFRVAENEACLDPFFTKNWVRLLLHFVEMTKGLPLPVNYREGDPWSGLLWLSPRDVFKVLKFDEPMSDGLKQVRDWFMGRIYRNGFDVQGDVPSIWTNKGRSVARAEFMEMAKEHWADWESFEYSDEILYGKKYII